MYWPLRVCSEKYFSKAIRLFRDSALQGYPSSLRALGESCVGGLRGENNFVMAHCYFLLAEEMGSLTAKHLCRTESHGGGAVLVLAVCNLGGDLSKKSRVDALEWMLLQAPEEVEIFFERHRLSYFNDTLELLKTTLPQPIFEEMESHIASVACVGHENEAVPSFGSWMTSLLKKVSLSKGCF
jgi:hypothetical protein